MPGEKQPINKRRVFLFSFLAVVVIGAIILIIVLTAKKKEEEKTEDPPLLPTENVVLSPPLYMSQSSEFGNYYDLKKSYKIELGTRIVQHGTLLSMYYRSSIANQEFYLILIKVNQNGSLEVRRGKKSTVRLPPIPFNTDITIEVKYQNDVLSVFVTKDIQGSTQQINESLQAPTPRPMILGANYITSSVIGDFITARFLNLKIWNQLESEPNLLFDYDFKSAPDSNVGRIIPSLGPISNSFIIQSFGEISQ